LATFDEFYASLNPDMGIRGNQFKKNRMKLKKLDKKSEQIIYIKIEPIPQILSKFHQHLMYVNFKKF